HRDQFARDEPYASAEEVITLYDITLQRRRPRPGTQAFGSGVMAIPALTRQAMNFDKSKALQERAHALIPGEAHVYAKGGDQYPVEAPGFIERGRGCRVWDVDGNEFVEYGMGLRSVSLGHGYAPVAEAAYRQALLGTNFVRPHPIEVQCAEMLVDLIPSTEM